VLQWDGEMDTHTFKIGDRVKASSVWQGYSLGTVDSFNDWWVIVKMDTDGVKAPFMEVELSHVTPNNVGMEVRPVSG
jgi:hypothetical protein